MTDCLQFLYPASKCLQVPVSPERIHICIPEQLIRVTHLKALAKLCVQCTAEAWFKAQNTKAISQS